MHFTSHFSVEPASTLLSGEKTARSRLFEPPMTLLAFDSRER